MGPRVIALEAPFNPEGGAYVKAENGAWGVTTTTTITIPAMPTPAAMNTIASTRAMIIIRASKIMPLQAPATVIAPTNTSMATTVAES